MATPHAKGCTIDNECQACLDVVRYVGWVRELGINKAQQMVREIKKNKKKIKK